ncbi:hypothetical protein J7I98_35925 [Streptomyces sp. ISL-98]|uniref:hypothetical protein n=1 Tax=Streptomyces sp. ISL-98 TaxID=2819192 RepID=UPI001BEB1051|nr:hypothetical protein [Streptomyces sp. ISL-98]MBT2511116.1 hypothetical protein [Streptomyces sp. ISL-98]
MTERQAEMPLGGGRHPDADAVDARLWRRGRARHRRGARPCWFAPSVGQEIARDKTLPWLEE